jgi:hypothetical protein
MTKCPPKCMVNRLHAAGANSDTSACPDASTRIGPSAAARAHARLHGYGHCQAGPTLPKPRCRLQFIRTERPPLRPRHTICRGKVRCHSPSPHSCTRATSPVTTTNDMPPTAAALCQQRLTHIVHTGARRAASNACVPWTCALACRIGEGAMVPNHKPEEGTTEEKGTHA